MDTFRFKRFEVYQDAKLFRKDVMELVSKLVNKKTYDLSDQIKRASSSVILNIAEGSAKRSDVDFARFLENAIGSVFEVVAGCDIAKDEKLITEDEYKLIEVKADSIAKQLGGFIKKLRNSSKFKK
ncbi:MAG: four helix bundle protein [Candidatus Peribacteraceae bacterium]|jgi:four helix bundle protein|nr:four helix bundle protein [Candidatus Peribacteraceae bacterium]HCI03687.1 hypothetical protein [Candidatus Peribacteria bacterium]|tara:strand:- start:10618 stop:10995 length:378 start_codon:yes stop_codon:yes gene_type:complete